MDKRAKTLSRLAAVGGKVGVKYLDKLSQHNITITEAVSCIDDECCGTLIEKHQIGNIECNECGQKYKLIKR